MGLLWFWVQRPYTYQNNPLLINTLSPQRDKALIDLVENQEVCVILFKIKEQYGSQTSK